MSHVGHNHTMYTHRHSHLQLVGRVFATKMILHSLSALHQLLTERTLELLLVFMVTDVVFDAS